MEVCGARHGMRARTASSSCTAGRKRVGIPSVQTEHMMRQGEFCDAILAAMRHVFSLGIEKGRPSTKLAETDTRTYRIRMAQPWCETAKLWRWWAARSPASHCLRCECGRGSHRVSRLCTNLNRAKSAGGATEVNARNVLWLMTGSSTTHDAKFCITGI